MRLVQGYAFEDAQAQLEQALESFRVTDTAATVPAEPCA